MRRKDKLVLDRVIIDQVILQAQICRIALVDGLRPYLIPLSFGYDGQAIYIHSASAGKKIELLKQNKNVCVEFEQAVQLVPAISPCNWGVSYLTVIGHGSAELILDEREKMYGIREIIRHYAPKQASMELSAVEVGAVLVYKITIQEFVGKKSGI